VGGGVVALGLPATACGSRTSMLDPDAYSSTGVGGSTAGSGNKSGSTGKAGSSGDPLDPNKSSAACTKYCNGYRVQCAAELGNRDCVATCTAEVNDRGKQCLKLGTEVLECLAPHFPSTGPSQGCKVVSDRAAAACGPLLSKFQSCAPESKPDQPTLRPDCVLNNVAGGTECLQIYECMEGPYLVQCNTTNPGNRTCTCISPTADPKTFTYGANVIDPCEVAASDCGFR
jgi:hypothetical protein